MAPRKRPEGLTLPIKPEPGSIEAYETLPVERRSVLIARYGDLYAAKDEVDQRKANHREEFQATMQLADLSRWNSEHLDLRNRMFDEKKEKNLKEIEECKKRIRVLMGRNVQMEAENRKLVEKIGETAGRWEMDRRVVALWDAFFELDIDEDKLLEGLEILGMEDQGNEKAA